MQRMRESLESRLSGVAACDFRLESCGPQLEGDCRVSQTTGTETHGNTLVRVGTPLSRDVFLNVDLVVYICFGSRVITLDIEHVFSARLACLAAILDLATLLTFCTGGHKNYKDTLRYPTVLLTCRTECPTGDPTQLGAAPGNQVISRYDVPADTKQ